MLVLLWYIPRKALLEVRFSMERQKDLFTVGRKDFGILQCNTNHWRQFIIFQPVKIETCKMTIQGLL